MYECMIRLLMPAAHVVPPIKWHDMDMSLTACWLAYANMQDLHLLEPGLMSFDQGRADSQQHIQTHLLATQTRPVWALQLMLETRVLACATTSPASDMDRNNISGQIAATTT